MRIIGGQHHRRILRPPAGLPVRPTTDKAKEALFNVLNHLVDFTGLRVLDLFAGTGSISYEFASRGAALVVAVDKHPRCIRYMKTVKEALELDKLVCLQGDVFRYLKQGRDVFDLVFADPPFSLPGLADIPDQVFSSQLLSREGILVLEHSDSQRFQAHPHFLKEKKYSKVHFSFFSQEGNIQ